MKFGLAVMLMGADHFDIYRMEEALKIKTITSVVNEK